MVNSVLHLQSLQSIASLRSWMVMMSMCLVFSDAFATHMKGGELTYEDLGGGQYLIRLVVYRDCGSNNANGTGFDGVAPIGIFNSAGQWINSIGIPLSIDNIEEIAYLTADSCTSIPASLCVQRATYEQQAELGVYAGGLTLSYQRCCRTPALVNLIAPDDAGVTLTATIPGTDMATINSSPVFNAPPVVAMCLGQPFAMSQSATDQDGDSLAYSLCSPLLGGTPNQPAPNPPNGPPYLAVSWAAGYSAANPISSSPPITIDAVTGELSGTPNQVGEYAMAICVEEWRDGVLLGTVFRDFHASVFLCGYADTDGDGICDGQEIPGCLDSAACNYDSLATDYDLTICDYSCFGCTDPESLNFNEGAEFDDGTCIYLTEVTFRLDMWGQDVSGSVFVTGLFDGWCGSCWEMLDEDGDDIYETSISMPSGEYPYLFLNGDWNEVEQFDNIEDTSCVISDNEGGFFRNVSVQGDQPIVLDAVCFNFCSPCAQGCSSVGGDSWSNVEMGVFPSSILAPFGLGLEEELVLNVPNSIPDPSTGLMVNVSGFSPISVSGLPIGLEVDLPDTSLAGSTQLCLNLTGVPYEYGEFEETWVGELQVIFFGITLNIDAFELTHFITIEPNPSPIGGCTIEGALNYDVFATFDDGSCQIEGCLDPAGLNFAPIATVSAQCIYPPLHCIYDAEAEDWSCTEFCQSDINQDGVVGVPDLLILLSDFAAGCE